jgi:hypothetical protein
MTNVRNRAAERRKSIGTTHFLSPLRGSSISTHVSHGSRRGLPSNAAPQLFALFPDTQILICARSFDNP